jgi:hypothetical protein
MYMIVSGACQADIHLGIEIFFCTFLYHSFQSVCDERGPINSFGFITSQKYRFRNSMENWKKSVNNSLPKYLLKIIMEKLFNLLNPELNPIC